MPIIYFLVRQILIDNEEVIKIEKKDNIKKGLFSTFCLGVGAVAAAPKAGETIKRVIDKIRDKREREQ